ncbi:MAG: TetR/AcrR family transcriptional regulator [Pelosinus sp.]|nr:TetR/AcrR family transcriptional regulator [Pelosinus sp.]
MTSQKIKQAALVLFAEKGYDATTLSEIADKTGIKKPSIYAHYPGKMELFLDIVDFVTETYRAAWTDALEKSIDLAPDERLEFIFFAISSYYITNRTYLSFLVRLWLFPPVDCEDKALLPLQELSETHIKNIAAIFKQGMAEKIFALDSPEEMAKAYFCLLDGYSSRVIRYPKFDFNYQKAISIFCKSMLLT